MTLTIGSLFSGIGGLELGLEWAGLGPVLWQVEADEYCRQVLNKRWPHTISLHEDVTNVGYWPAQEGYFTQGNLQHVDIIAGGFPCQDISWAGSGAGLEGERSGLWREFYRIICELRPRYVAIENVAALLHRGLGVILRDFARIGFDAEWSVVSACSVGAPHVRRRLFIVAYPDSLRELQPQGRESNERGWTCDGSPSQVMAHTNCSRLEGRNSAELQECSGERAARTRGASVADPDAQRRNTRDISRSRETHEKWPRQAATGPSWWSAEPDVGRVAHGVPARVDRLRALGNAVVPQVAEIVGQVILERERQLAEAS